MIRIFSAFKNTNIFELKNLVSQVILLFNAIICERRIIVIGSNYENVTSFILSRDILGFL